MASLASQSSSAYQTMSLPLSSSFPVSQYQLHCHHHLIRLLLFLKHRFSVSLTLYKSEHQSKAISIIGNIQGARHYDTLQCTYCSVVGHKGAECPGGIFAVSCLWFPGWGPSPSPPFFARIESQWEPGSNTLTARSKAEYVKFISQHNLQPSLQSNITLQSFLPSAPPPIPPILNLPFPGGVGPPLRPPRVQGP